MSLEHAYLEFNVALIIIMITELVVQNIVLSSIIGLAIFVVLDQLVGKFVAPKVNSDN